MTERTIQLTQTVKKGGCAAKIAATQLRDILSKVRLPPQLERVLVDGRSFDDAAVYRITDEISIVQTLDFFTPIIDTPRIFGRIAAANAISDVCAMGASPATCLAILAFPPNKLENEVVSEILQGACDVIEQCQANLVGGHSIDDDTLKFGLSVTGTVGTDRFWTNAGAQPGDVLILTKPIGTGTLTAGLKQRNYTENQIQEAIDSMCAPNLVADLLTNELHSSVHAATDITGFGLSGHSMQMAKESGVTLKFTEIPTFEMARGSIEQEHLTKAHRTNREYTEKRVCTTELSPVDQLLVHDPQTSGGLLLAVDRHYASKLLEVLLDRFPRSLIVGEVVDEQEKSVIF